MTARRLLALAALSLAPLPAAALEESFGHEDAHGPVVELLVLHDTVVANGVTTQAFRPAVRAGWGLDVTGSGGELIVAADLSLRSWDDPERGRVLASATARYRGYFGSEEWKSWFEAGVWVPLASRLGIGPLVGIGAMYDFSRGAGVFAGAEFATAIGDGRVVSFGALAGFQLRYDLP
jgi:hypothetical protein